MKSLNRRSTTRVVTAQLSATEIVIVTVILVVLAAAVLLGGHSSGPTLDRTTTVKVRPGDTWWSLAERHPVAGATTAELADAIAAANGARLDELTVGSVVRVPAAAQDTDSLAMLDVQGAGGQTD